MLVKNLLGKKEKKATIEILYDPREEPVIEIYFISDELAERDAGLKKANERARIVRSSIYQVVRAAGFDPDAVIKDRYIEELGKPHYVPCIYVNGVLFSTIYTYKPEKLYNILKQMYKIREEYFNKIYKDIQYGYVVYPNKSFIHLRNPMYINWLTNSKDMVIARDLGLPTASVDPFDEIPATRWLISSLSRLGVPVTPVGFSTEVKYKVLILPEKKHIEL